MDPNGVSPFSPAATPRETDPPPIDDPNGVELLFVASFVANIARVSFLETHLVFRSNHANMSNNLRSVVEKKATRVVAPMNP